MFVCMCLSVCVCVSVCVCECTRGIELAACNFFLFSIICLKIKLF